VAYRDPTPLFTRYGVERQLNAMFQPQVTLRSGGYIVINQTEALVAIDVNSGKSTREFSIEETALATNLEAADEIARQLKLRDLAGLIVIDFIDMEEKRNNRSVERRLKDALRFDRARIQLGRISHFGLMEMSRQRLRTGVLEGSTSQCAHCQGTGIIRSTESIALAVLRGIEDVITAGASGPLIATTTPAVALYILNSKRAYIADMEVRHGYSVTVLGSDRVQGANFTVERTATSALPIRRSERAAVNMDWGFDAEGEVPAYASDADVSNDTGDGDSDNEVIDREPRNGNRDGDENGNRRGRRRRRRGRGGRDRNEDRGESYAHEPRDDESDGEHGTHEHSHHDAGEDHSEIEGLGDQPMIGDAPGSEDAELNSADDKPNKRRRRGRRGGRRGRGREASADAAETSADGDQPDVDDQSDESPEHAEHAESIAHADAEEPDMPAAPAAPARRSRRVWDVPSAANGADDGQEESAAPAPEAAASSEPQPQLPVAEEAPAPVAAPTAPARRRHETGSSEPRIERVVVGPGEKARDDEPAAAVAPQRKGWWQRKFSGE